MGLKALELLLPLSRARVDAFVEHPQALLVAKASRPLEGDPWVGADPVVLLLAVLCGWVAVAPEPIPATSRVDLQQQPATIRDPMPLGSGLGGPDLGFS